MSGSNGVGLNCIVSVFGGMSCAIYAFVMKARVIIPIVAILFIQDLSSFQFPKKNHPKRRRKAHRWIQKKIFFAFFSRFRKFSWTQASEFFHPLSHSTPNMPPPLPHVSYHIRFGLKKLISPSIFSIWRREFIL